MAFRLCSTNHWQQCPKQSRSPTKLHFLLLVPNKKRPLLAHSQQPVSYTHLDVYKRQVSHDRDFLTGLTDKVYEFRNRQIKPYLGDIHQFLEERKIETLDELNLGMRKSAAMAASNNQIDDKARREQLRQLEKQIKTQQNKISKSEKNIAELEQKTAQCEATMADANFYATNPNPQSFIANYDQLKKQLSTEMDTWAELTMELEQWQKEQDKLLIASY